MAGLLFRKVKDMRLALAQVTLVIAAFALMAFTSYSYTSKLERNHLLRDAQDALAYAQSYIEADLQEPKTALAGMAEATRNMVMNGADVDKVREWLGDITDYIMNSDDMMSHTAGVYGMFDCFGGQYIDGTDWAPDESYIPGERPWYTAAVEANGEIGVTAPYSDSSLDGGLTVTYARRIFDDSGNPLGIVCIDILLDRVRGYTSDMLLTDNSYGILLDGNLDIIAHPDSAYLGRSLYLLNDGPAIAADILSGKDFGSYDALSYQSERSALFYKRLSNGWYLGIMAPYNKYYQTIQNMAWFLALLGAGFAAVLSAVLLRVTAGKIRSDQESRQKSNFLATVSHEIRTPLNAIIGVAEIELQDEGLPPGFRDALVKIYTSGYSLLGIINDLLDLSKIEAGKMEITPAPYDTASLAYDTAQLNIMRLGSKPLEFDLRVDENTPAQLLGDELRIKQILNNLLSNAFKYTDTGKVTLEVRPEKGEDGQLVIVFVVRDTGYGMSAEQVSRLFDEYSRFQMEASRTTVGTGLGMSITKRLVDMMGGALHVESKLGAGSVFTVRLPQEDAGNGVLGKELSENLRQFRVDFKDPFTKNTFTREYMPYGSALVVDDVETNLYVAKGLLSPYGLAVDTALSGPEAIAKIKSGRIYDIILMDHMMPEMDGIEATQKIREQGYAQPIVALTANAMSGQAEMFLSRGFDAFISKPIDLRQMDVTLNKLVRDRYPIETIEAARKQKRTIAAKTPKAATDPQLAGIFARDAEDAVAALEDINSRWDTISPDDLALYIVNVHAMKSALANIGAPELSGAALRLEQAGRKRDTSLLREETVSFITDLRAVIGRIKPKEPDRTGGVTDEDKALLREKWLVIQAACEAYDKKGAKDALAELRRKVWPRPVKEALEAVAEHLLHSDFEEAAAVAGREAQGMENL